VARFARQAARAPEAVALVSGDRHLSYGELARRSATVSRRLRESGVGPDSLVPLCVHRTPELIVGLLGILGAGAAYAPLDPLQPAARLRSLREELGAAPVVADELGRQALGATGTVDPAAAGESAGGFPGLGVPPEALAYVLFTSGSTGRPKGVGVSRGALAATLAALGRLTDIRPADCFLAVTSLTFDIAAVEILLPLLVGARVVLADRDTAQDGGRLVRALVASGATLLQGTPATWRMLLDAGYELPAGLKILCGGEALPADLAVSLARLGGPAWNLYGPTEATIWATAARLAAGAGSVPIGRPLETTYARVLGADLQPVPAGDAGELFLGGEAVARGYLGLPGLTAERFLPDPAADCPGARLYRTGDRCRWLADGQLEFLGRYDEQMKLRGYRIEPAEVEAALRLHPAVAEAAVAVREPQPGDAVLVAYVVPRTGEEPAAAGLRAFLQERLPDYMIPDVFLRLATLPLTPHRKLDRRALPEPGALFPLTAPAEPPQDANEARLAVIWAEVLGIARVSRQDDFFALGGNSLRATRLLARVREAFGCELALTDLLRAATPAGLAAELGHRAAAPPFAPVMPQPADAGEPFPLTAVQEAYWVGGAQGPGSIRAHEYLEVDGSGIDLPRLEAAYRRLFARHGMLRARFLDDGRQRIDSRAEPPAITVEDLAGAGEEAIAARLAVLRAALSHLPAGDPRPLFAIRVTRLGGTRCRLHLSCDLIASDAGSLRILIADLVRLYGQPQADLAPLSLSFRDYVLAERRLGDRPGTGLARAYWQSRLPELPPPPELALVRRRDVVAAPRFERRTVTLKPAVWRRLSERGARESVGPTALLLAAYCDVLATWSRLPRFTLNLPAACRLPLHPDCEHLVGDFTTLLPFAVEPRTGASFAARAVRIQQQLWEDLDHREGGRGLEMLRELARRGGKPDEPALPFVFTSLLGLAGADPADSLQEIGEVVYRLTQTPQIILDVLVWEESGALAVAFDAVEDRFPAGALDAMVAAYRGLLLRLAENAGAMQEPGRRLAPAGQLARHARANSTAVPLPEVPLHLLVAEQVRRTPEAVAVVAGDRRLSYRELAARATGVALWLRARGAAPDRLVAVVMEKGWEQVVAVLGILEAGSAYLPVDPALPRLRRDALLADGEVALILTQSRLATSLDWPAGLELLAVDSAEPIEAAPLAAVQGADHLVYVLYTSGSTGSPKGVMVSHRGAVNAILDAVRRFRLDAGDRTLALTALDHDMSVFDLFGPLAVGGAVIVPLPGRRRDPEHWLELMARERVTIWNSVPAFLAMLLEHVDDRPGLVAESLRLALLGGDWVPIPLVQRLRRLHPGVEVVSVGGPTETTLWNICHPVGEIDPAWTSIPYGNPIANNRYHVLDEDLEERPTWVAGELVCGGVGLARGYWRDEARTRERFIVHPVTGERLYRTGDLGRRLPDATIEFLGRGDFQVKLQGRRIELGEIEATLARHPAVRAAAAVAIDGPGARQLVAYVVPRRSPAAGGEWLGTLAAALDDAGERAAFKLESPGLRSFPASRCEVTLERPPAGAELDALYAERRSYRSFADGPLALQAVGRLLACLYQIELAGMPLAKARYPSGGGLYPVQAYLYAPPGRVEGLAGGTYYYHPRHHRLIGLDPDARLDRSLHTPPNREIFEGSAFSLFLVGQLRAVRPMYGELARDLCLLEAGYMGQLLMAAAPSLGVGLCPIGVVAADPLRAALALDGDHEILHSLLGGPIEPAQKTPAGLAREAAETAGRGGAAGLEAELREWLRERLPEYMVPSRFVMLDELPMTASGKVDRRALPVPSKGDPPPREEMPATAVERVVAAEWQRIAGVTAVGLHDNFFDLGGTSLHLVQLNRRLREVCGRDIPIVEMFRRPNVAALSRYLEGGGDPAGSERVEERIAKMRAGAGSVQELFDRARKGHRG
jgi:amino acid adenylation domain-containing protein